MAQHKEYEKTVGLFQQIVKETLTPPPDLTVSQWADEHRVLSSESSAEPGQWDTNRAPYQREIMDAVTNPLYEEIVIMASAQVGKSELLLNAVGYHIDMDPGPMMIVQPTQDKAKDFSKERLAPMIRDCKTLRKKVSDAKSRDSNNTVSMKAFPGGYVALEGANSPAGLASRPVRILLVDEIDRFPVSAGEEGDPLDLAEKRTTTFYNRKIIKVSTPTIKGVSRIEKEFEASTKEYYHLPCPGCGEYQPLTWNQIDFETNNHRCSTCGFLFDEFQWKDQQGKWVALQPEAEKRGFHLNELLSPWRKWSEIIKSFKDAKRKGMEAMKVWVNTSLGETWEEEGESIDSDDLTARLEEYKADIPDEVKVLTASVDVQDDRFEIEVVGWGPGKESWGIEYHKIYGDLNEQRVWNDLDLYLSKTWSKQDGKRFGIACTCMDSGGHFTQEVYRFTKVREARRVYAIKGKSIQKGEYVPLIAGYSKTKIEEALLISLGVNDGKSRVMSNLQIQDFGPNYCHFPSKRGYDANYFAGLTAEKLVTRYEKGVPYQVWKKIRVRNEPLDLRVYNIAALEIINPNLEKEYTAANVQVRKKKKRKSSRGVRA